MNTSCLVAVKRNSLLSQILANLINSAGHELMLIYSEANNLEELIREIDTFNADVVVLEKSLSFASDKNGTKLITLFSKLLVIILSEDSNWFSVFSREDKLLVSSADLLSVISSKSN